MFRYLSYFVLLGVFSLPAKADPITLSSPQQQVALLELFTSEGCSSCPPADRWLSELKSDPRLWREVVPVAFHVDYWDYIGWPDRFASAEYGQRQRLHAMSWGNGRVYTPGLVVNGEEWYGWFRNRNLQLDGGNKVGTLQLTVDRGQCQARFMPLESVSGSLELHIAVLGFGLSTEVEAGENRGRELKHDFVVLGYKRVPLQTADALLQAYTELPPTSVGAPRRAVAAWISTSGNPRPLQAVGGWL